VEDNVVSSHPWPAPAKINLFLHVVGRQENGYHHLQTVFQFLDYADELKFDLFKDELISLDSNYTQISNDNDLILRAANALKQASGVKKGAAISVMKHIPIGGGLGGGSSDAATTLVALNELWHTGFSVDELVKLGVKLGADVPVFIRGHSAWAEGIGEILTPIEPDEDWFVVIHPGCHVPTAQIFADPDLTRNSPPITIRDFVAGAVHNDCEQVVFREYPEVARAAKWLNSWSDARMTGTGSCIFGRFNNKLQADEVLKQLPAEWQGFVAQGINYSPLMERLALEKQD